MTTIEELFTRVNRATPEEINNDVLVADLEQQIKTADVHPGKQYLVHDALELLHTRRRLAGKA